MGALIDRIVVQRTIYSKIISRNFERHPANPKSTCGKTWIPVAPQAQDPGPLMLRGGILMKASEATVEVVVTERRTSWNGNAAGNRFREELRFQGDDYLLPKFQR